MSMPLKYIPVLYAVGLKMPSHEQAQQMKGTPIRFLDLWEDQAFTIGFVDQKLVSYPCV